MPGAPDDLMQQALRSHQSGNARAAEEIYRAIVRDNPNHAAATHFLGLLAHQAGDHAAAIALMRRSIELDGRVADFHNNLALAHQATGDLDAAVAQWRAALALRPDFVDALNNLGNALRQARKYNEAIDPLRTAAALAPESIIVQTNLGRTLVEAGLPEQSIGPLSAAVSLAPSDPATHVNLGNALRDANRVEEAIPVFRRAIELSPARPEPRNNLATCLMRLGEIERSLDEFRAARQLRPHDHGIWSNLLFALHHHPQVSASQLFQEHVDWARQLPAERAAEPDTRRVADRRLRIGYVSSDFRNHSLGQFIAPIIDGHDRNEFTVCCYSNNPWDDSMTGQIRARAALWHDIRSRTDDQVIELIRQDGIDILVDLTCHAGHNRLGVFAAKPAPVQMTYLAYPGTTGLRAVDYKITDPHIDPPGVSESFHSEALVRLTDSYFCYPAPVTSPAVNAPPALTNGCLTFASFNSFAKVNGHVLALWARVLTAVARARLIMISGSVNAPLFERRVRGVFENAGISADRVELIDMMNFGDYLSRHNHVDVQLDPFPFNGGTTSCHSLWMGVPIITLARGHGVSRMGASVLRNVGLDQLIARDQDDYVRIAAELGRDFDSLRDIRIGLRDRMHASPLMNRPGIVSNLESIYRRAWNEFCARS